LLVKFPSHYPADCPPADSKDASVELFRFVKNTPPLPSDFTPVKWKSADADPCNMCGLSVLVTIDDVKHARDTCPWFRKQKVAKARLSPEWGKYRQTMSVKVQNHHTWWVAEGKTPEKIFDVIEV
jgi:hypothetical protein